MRAGTGTVFLMALVVAPLCGCNSLTRPSDQVRHVSYARIQGLFAANQEAASRQTYIVFSGDSELELSTLKAKSKLGSVGAAFSCTKSESINRGLAVGLDSDGYLLTAGHVVEEKSFVLGWFDGRIDLRPARLVFRSNFKIPADVALLKLEGKLDHCAIFGEKPKVGERVAAVVCYYKAKESGGTIDFIGGTVIKVAGGPAGSSVALVETDLPTWRGDSGGPLLSSSGGFVGIFTRYEYRWFGHDPKYRTTCFFPDRGFIQSLIARDRASIRAGSKTTGANAGGPRPPPVRTRRASRIARFCRYPA
jgi:hypothetical protein